MKPADDPGIDYVRLVEAGYDAVSAEFNATRRMQDADALAPLFERLPDGARVLDLGCGAGVPVARALAERFAVRGVDISAGQLALAREQVSGATFVQADMRTFDVPEASLDAVVSFYAIFHLPREEHAGLFGRIHRWLRPGGLLLASLAWRDEAAYTEDFLGVEMHWSNYAIEEYRQMLAAAGFVVLETRELTAWPDEVHPLVLAEKV